MSRDVRARQSFSGYAGYACWRLSPGPLMRSNKSTWMQSLWLELSEPAVRGRIRRGSARLREEIERLAANPELMASTCGDLDGWLAQLREVCGHRA